MTAASSPDAGPVAVAAGRRGRADGVAQNDRLAKLVAARRGRHRVRARGDHACSTTSPAARGNQFAGSMDWIPSFGVHISFGMDGIALVMVAMIAFLVPVVLGRLVERLPEGVRCRVLRVDPDAGSVDGRRVRVHRAFCST